MHILNEQNTTFAKRILDYCIKFVLPTYIHDIPVAYIFSSANKKKLAN